MSLVDNVVLVQRDNVILRIDRSQIAEYMNKGYNVIDANGNIIQKTIPTDVLTLQAEYKRQEDEILALEAQVKELKAQLRKKTKKSTTD